MLSDGKDSGPTSFRERPSSQADVIDRARREDVMIDAVGMRSRSPPMPAGGLGPGGLQAMLVADLPDPGLARVAEERAGGIRDYPVRTGSGARFAGVTDELHTQYLLAFTPPTRDGKLHEVSVRVTPGGLKTRAKKNYVAPTSQNDWSNGSAPRHRRSRRAGVNR